MAGTKDNPSWLPMMTDGKFTEAGKEKGLQGDFSNGILAGYLGIRIVSADSRGVGLQFFIRDCETDKVLVEYPDTYIGAIEASISVRDAILEIPVNVNADGIPITLLGDKSDD